MGIETALLGLAAAASAAAPVLQGFQTRKAERVNAFNQRKQADLTEQQTASEVLDQRARRRQFMSGQIAELNAQGAQIGSGTALAFADQAGRDAMLDELNIITDGGNRARALRSNASQSDYRGQTAMTQGILGGLGKAMSGGVQAWKGLQ